MNFLNRQKKVKMDNSFTEIEPMKNKDCKESSLEWYNEESISFQNIIISVCPQY
ncbi:MAG: hypothetical protein U9O65_00595 [Thermotogota bacterium]|nr:hypothetical protein [Thermotogota bacterium]